MAGHPLLAAVLVKTESKTCNLFLRRKRVLQIKKPERQGLSFAPIETQLVSQVPFRLLQTVNCSAERFPVLYFS